ncbi:hypothetical protein CSKR_104319 [Clonorchis sinensis]|uniref:Uncharacterized protein n=2 Tax=Clonorchis sinensis TaxID=79923 RepID=G7YH99_CLOSI|nr:hypothetical protein CSKR_104319 [Clonorchis sinensis]GAA52332.1 hypothetical protein CLF_107860 [Clonorchis sinensis]
MSVNANSNAGSTNSVQSNSPERPQTQNIDLNMIARQLAIASSAGTRTAAELPSENLKYADGGRISTDVDQQWHQYLLQLQMQLLRNSAISKSESPTTFNTGENPTGQLLSQAAPYTSFSSSNAARGNQSNLTPGVSVSSASTLAPGTTRTSAQTVPTAISETPVMQLGPENVPLSSNVTSCATPKTSFSQAPVDANMVAQLLCSPILRQPEQLIACLTELLRQQQLRNQQPRLSRASVSSVASVPTLATAHSPAVARQNVISSPGVPLFIATTSADEQTTNDYVNLFSNLSTVDPQSASPNTDQAVLSSSQHGSHSGSLHQDSTFRESLGTIDSSNESQAQSSVESDLRALDQFDQDSTDRNSMVMRDPAAQFGDQEHSQVDATKFMTDRYHLLRPRLRAHYRDRFLVRVIRITYQCSCRSNQPTEHTKAPEPKRFTCSGSDCKGNEPRTYVTFQAQLPSISSSFRATIPGNQLSHGTGLRLGFTCSLASRGPALQDFANPKVAERLDAWEQAGNMPGFRCQVLAALHDTVGLILQKVREEGVTAIALDTDYVFYPATGELRPAVSRRRQLSASSDSSVPRMTARSRIYAEPARIVAKHLSSMEKPTEIDTEPVTGEREQTVWSEVVSCVETSEYSRRPRTWHQVSESLQCSPRMGESQDRQSARVAALGPGPSYTLNIPKSWGDELGQSPLTCDSMVSGHLSRTGSADSWTQPVDNGLRQDGVQTSISGRPRNLVLGHERRQLMHGDQTLSTPVSPTRFLRHRRFANLCLERAGASQAGSMSETQMRTAPSSPLPGSRAHHKSAPDADDTKLMTSSVTDNQSPAGERYHSSVDTIVREIANRLQTNPQLPLVVMPTTMNEPEGKEPSTSPLVFQLPHPNSTFVCLPANTTQLPRVVTAPKSGTLVVIPRTNTTTSETGLTTTTYQQPLVVTGPREGYLLIITPDNNFDYIPIGELTRLITPRTQ